MDRYEEALERAKKNYRTAQDLCDGSLIGVECFKNTLTSIFPELKESDDEKVRKAIVELVLQSSEILGSNNQSRMLAWLEKQGNNEQILANSAKTCKDAWSEEDEVMCQETIDWFEQKCFPYASEEENPARRSIQWLKSLKERLQ
jgi:hypothetical protein